MDHRWIEEQGVAEEYVLGRLAAAEAETFEDHLLVCLECRERVRWTEEIQGSLRAMAAEDRRRTASGPGLLAWLAGHGRPARMVFAAGLLLVLALAAGFLVEEMRLRRTLAEMRTAATRQGEQPRTVTPPGPARPGTEQAARQLDEQLRQREADLDHERQRADGLRARLAQLSRPEVNAAIVSLGLVRGGEAVHRVPVGPRPAWIVLSIELPAPPSDRPNAGGTYRASLLDSRGRMVWSGDGLRPTASDTLALGLFSDLLAPGAYRLVLDGPREAPQRSEIPFQVVRED